MTMKPLRYTLSILALASVILLGSGCSKDDEPSQEEKLARTWVMTDMLANISGQTSSVYIDNVDACQRDDEYSFAQAGAVSVNSGAIKCDEAELNPIASGTWSFLEGGKKISLNVDGTGAETFDVDELSTKSMKVSQSDNSTGFLIKITLVFTSK